MLKHTLGIFRVWSLLNERNNQAFRVYFFSYFHKHYELSLGCIISSRSYFPSCISRSRETGVILDGNEITDTSNSGPIPTSSENKMESLGSQTTNCDVCNRRKPQMADSINQSLDVIEQIVEHFQVRSTILILDDRNEIEKSFYRFLASSLKFSDSHLASTLFYGLADKTTESYAYYRKGWIKLKVLQNV